MVAWNMESNGHVISNISVIYENRFQRVISVRNTVGNLLLIVFERK